MVEEDMEVAGVREEDAEEAWMEAVATRRQQHSAGGSKGLVHAFSPRSRAALRRSVKDRSILDVLAESLAAVPQHSPVVEPKEYHSQPIFHQTMIWFSI